VPTPLDALAGVANRAQPTPDLVTGGQPGQSHFEALRAAGVEVVLDIRDPMEPRPFDEPGLLQSLGMEYVCIPVMQGSLTDQLMERLLEVVRANQGRSMLFHCASGNRVAGPMIAYLMLDQGMDEEAAVMEGMKMGLRGPDVMEWGVDYARRKLAGR